MMVSHEFGQYSCQLWMRCLLLSTPCKGSTGKDLHSLKPCLNQATLATALTWRHWRKNLRSDLDIATTKAVRSGTETVSKLADSVTATAVAEDVLHFKTWWCLESSRSCSRCRSPGFGHDLTALHWAIRPLIKVMRSLGANLGGFLKE